MTSSTTTSFRQKTCPKCKNNHDNEGVLCSFCVDSANHALKKIQTAPSSFWVKCLIEREGNTTLALGNIQYTFERNQAGDAVCEIINLGHYTQIVKSDFYEPYIPEPVAPAVPIQTNAAEPFYFTDDETRMIDRMHHAGETHTAIAAKISAEYGRQISRQRVTKYIQM